MNSRRLLTDDEFRDVSEEVLPFGRVKDWLEDGESHGARVTVLMLLPASATQLHRPPSIGHPGPERLPVPVVQCHSFDTA